jgi:uncharacterized membrane protein
VENTTAPPSSHRASLRVASMLGIGVAAAVLVGLLGGWIYAPAAGWIAAAVSYTGWVWLRIGRMDHTATRLHATREDPSRAVADVLLVVASLASLGVVAFVLIRAATASGLERGVLASLAIASVALSWTVIHTLFTLRYASLYYAGEPGGVDFNAGAAPDYGDFAYLSFTLGMTYQVSDTGLQSRAFRVTALRQGLLSYVFGAVILATTVNLVAGLGA